jgi:hypothetical protein
MRMTWRDVLTRARWRDVLTGARWREVLTRAWWRDVLINTRWRDVLKFASVAGAAPLIIFLLILLTPAPPVAEMANARIKLSQAGSRRADTYSKKL